MAKVGQTRWLSAVIRGRRGAALIFMLGGSPPFLAPGSALADAPAQPTRVALEPSPGGSENGAQVKAPASPRAAAVVGGVLVDVGLAAAFAGVAATVAGASFHPGQLQQYRDGIANAWADTDAGITLLSVGGAALIGGVIALALSSRSNSHVSSPPDTRGSLAFIAKDNH